MSRLLDVLLGSCAHNRCTFPMRIESGQRRSGTVAGTGIYIVCLDCGKELAYSWDEMKVVPASRRRRPRRTLSIPNLTARVAEELNLWR